jgi:hypothetical protein
MVRHSLLGAWAPAYRAAVLSTRPVGYWRLGEAAASTVSNISVASPTHITTSTPHGILNGATVVISGSTGGVLSINGTNVATVLDATHFTIPVAVTVAGSGGTVNILYAVDEMGANNGTYVNTPTLGVAGLLAGDANTAVTFAAASGQHVSFAPIDLHAGDFTQAAWIKAGADTGSNRTLIGGPQGAPSLQILSSYLVAVFTCTYVADAPVYGATALSPGQQFFVAATYKLSTGTLTLYVNGVQDGVNAVATGWNPAWTGVGDEWIGAQIDGFGRLANDTIQEPAIWNRALTAAEIAMLNAIGRGTW